MMNIPFRPVTAADADLLRSFTMEGKCMNCDLNVANICSWQFLYHTEWAVVEGMLVLRFVLDGRVTYMKPIGRGDLHHVLRLLMDDARSMGDTLRVACICPCAQAVMEESMPGVFTYTIDRDKSDYLYLRERLVTLTGKKLQPKRNHISKFKRTYPDYEYRPLTADLVPHCISLGEEWCHTNDSGMLRAMLAEQRMIRYALSHMDELHIVGGTLWVEDKMVAFTFGSRINGEAFDVCVEKADTSYEGAYAMINNEFVSRLPEDITYINREEDLGLEGLRKAKMSYYPDLIMDKMVATLTAQPKETEEEMRERFETRHLWERSFADPKTFIDLYFREKYRKERNETIVRDGRVVSALQKLPYPMTYGGHMLPASYISGACTDERYRRRGLMGELLVKALEGEFLGVKEYRSEGVQTNVSSANGLSSSLQSEAETPILLNSQNKSANGLSSSLLSEAKTPELLNSQNKSANGLSSTLLSEAETPELLHSQNKAGSVLSFLIPATPELATYYAKYGYTPCFRFGWTTVSAEATDDTALTAGIVEQPHEEEYLIYLRQKMQERPLCVQHPLSDLRAVVDDMRMGGDTMWEVRRDTMLVGLAICRAEADGTLLRECVYDDDTARQALINAIATHYGRTEVDIIDTTGREGEYMGMARIIDAEAMLAAYAALHPEVEALWSVTDELLSANNACYRIAQGVCTRLDEPCTDAEGLTIAQLTHRIVTEENPLMSLMMND